MRRINILSKCLVKNANVTNVKENVIYFDKILKIVYDTIIVESTTGNGTKIKNYFCRGTVFFNSSYNGGERTFYLVDLEENIERIVSTVGSEIPELRSLMKAFLVQDSDQGPLFEFYEIENREISLDRTGLYSFNVLLQD